jgi:large subunit ribosomal protein L13
MKTFVPKVKDIVRNWYVVDATGKSVGRLATEVARVLRGKHKSIFSHHLDIGDGVIVINANSITLTGNKWKDKKYYRYSGYVGNLKTIIAEKMHEKDPTFIVRAAIAGMIPRTKFKKSILKRLKVYSGSEHKHDAQNPKILEI